MLVLCEAVTGEVEWFDSSHHTTLRGRTSENAENSVHDSEGLGCPFAFVSMSGTHHFNGARSPIQKMTLSSTACG